MKVKIWQLILLVSFSLLGIIGLQVYYALKVYKQQEEIYKSEVNRAFEQAVDRTNEQRLIKINSLFEQEISDTTQVELKYEVTREGSKLLVLDPHTGYRHLSMSHEQFPDTLLDHSALIQFAVKENWKLLRNERILYWTNNIGDKMKSYLDSLSISMEALEQNMKAELLSIGIEEDFQFIQTDSLHSYASNDRSFKFQKRSVKLNGETLLSVKIDKPKIAILKRLTVVFALTLLALMLLFSSFLYLYIVLKRQRQLSELKDDFIDNVTHELITPTATLQLALETLEKYEHESSFRYVSIARQHADRIEAIVNKILKSFLNQIGNETIKLEKVDVSSLLEDMAKSYEVTYGDQIKFITSIDHTIHVHSHKEHLSTALHNLINNAIKYGHPTEPEINLSLAEKEGSVVISIEDNGQGIPKEHHKLIFDKFHRVPSSTHDVKGLGIGLYQSKMLMNKINGDLILKSSSAAGSCFCVHLKKNIEYDT